MQLAHLEQITTSDVELVLAALADHYRPAPTLAELWTWWLTTPDARAMPWRGPVESRWRRWLELELGKLRTTEVTAEAINLALERVELAGKSAQTVNHCITDLGRIVRAAQAARRWKGPDPMPWVRRRSLEPMERPTLTREEAGELLELADQPHQVMYALAIYLGLRKGEVLALERGDVDLEHQVLHVRRSHDRRTTKNGRHRHLPICSELAPILRAWLELGAGDLLLFPGAGLGGRKGRDFRLTDRLRCALQNFAIAEHAASTIRFHDLRHTFATLADEAGIQEEVISAVLGHRPSVTGRYTHRRVARLLEKLELLRLK